jgi:hypothetical protein
MNSPFSHAGWEIGARSGLMHIKKKAKEAGRSRIALAVDPDQRTHHTPGAE